TAQPVAAMPVSRAAADIPVQSMESLLPIPLVASAGVTIQPYISSGVRYLSLNGINLPGTVQAVPSYLIGVQFDLGDRWAFRAQGGSSSFAVLQPEKIIEPAVPWPVYQDRVIAKSGTMWSTIGMSYSLPVIGSVPLLFSGDAGAVFFSNTTGLMGRIGAATEIPISHQFLFRPSLTYDFVWTSLPGVASSNGGSGFYTNPVSSSSMLSTAMGFNISLVFRP
ncbi:MAG: hypothetical protein ACHQNE_07735, partial [Candidatus Kapaibacterium sp.]